MKYIRHRTSMGVIPYEISLTLEITNCPHKCKGCHSPELWLDIGKNLTVSELDKICDKYCFNGDPMFTCITFMGGDQHHSEICQVLKHIKDLYPQVKTALYTGSECVSEELKGLLNYLKTGKYNGTTLNDANTNQKMTNIC